MLARLLTDGNEPRAFMDSASRPAQLHYAWIVAGSTFLVLLVTAGIHATPAIAAVVVVCVGSARV
jgi:hypothetical protein